MKSNTTYVLALSIAALLIVGGYTMIRIDKTTATPIQGQNNHQHDKHQATIASSIGNLQDRAGTISGATNPGAIPDHVAFELFLRSLIPQATDNEREQKRVRLYARDAGFEGAEADIILRFAEDFGKQIGELDKQAANIKNANWPKPSEATIQQLNRLEEQRVALVKNLMETLPTRIGAGSPVSQARSEKVLRYLNEQVKRKVKLTTSEIPK